MKTNYNIIGDIHGRTSWKELVTDSGINIFVGDYFDPYERIPHQQLMQNFADIVDFKKQHPETILLYGNHDLHYLIKQERASRYSILHARQYRKAFEDSSDLFYGVAYAIKDTILVSHAGVTKEWYEKEFGNYDGEAVSEVESLINDLWKHNKIEFTFDANALWGFDVSGSSPTHSPLWIRPWTLAEHNLLAGTPYKQIFGHTQMDDTIIIDDNLICVDCLGKKVKSYSFSL